MIYFVWKIDLKFFVHPRQLIKIFLEQSITIKNIPLAPNCCTSRILSLAKMQNSSTILRTLLCCNSRLIWDQTESKVYFSNRFQLGRYEMNLGTTWVAGSLLTRNRKTVEGLPDRGGEKMRIGNIDLGKSKCQKFHKIKAGVVGENLKNDPT